MKLFNSLLAASAIAIVGLAGAIDAAEAGNRGKSYSSKYYSGGGSKGTSKQTRSDATSYHAKYSGEKVPTGCERHRVEWEKTGNGRALGRYYRCIYQ